MLFPKGETLDDKTLKKILKSKYGKDIVFYNLCKEYIKNGIKKGKFESKKLLSLPPLFKKGLPRREEICHIQQPV